MNGLSRVAGIGPRVTINGREYQIRGKTNRFYADVEAQIIHLRGDPMDQIVESAQRGKLNGDANLVEVVAGIVSEKFRNWRVATYMDYLDFMNSPAGDALALWHCIKDDAPDVPLEDVKTYIIQSKFYGDEANRTELKAAFQAIAVASGEDRLGNSTGQPGPATTATALVESSGS